VRKNFARAGRVSSAFSVNAVKNVGHARESIAAGKTFVGEGLPPFSLRMRR
jgi:hypothetical protein